MKKYWVKVSYEVEKEVEANSKDEATELVAREMFENNFSQAELLDCKAELLED